MTNAQQKFVQLEIDKHGLDYALRWTRSWREIEDKEFRSLLDEYKKIASKIEMFINEPDHYRFLNSFQATSQPPAVKGAVWVKAINGLPADRKRNYIFRQANNTRSAQVVYLDHVNDISTYLKLPLEDIEYLDESPTAAVDEKEAKDFGNWLRWQNGDVFYGPKNIDELYEIFRQSNHQRRKNS